MEELTNPNVFFTLVLPISIAVAVLVWAVWVVYFMPGAEQPRQAPHDPGTGDE